MLNGSAFAQIDATLTGDVRLAGDLDELPSGGQVGDENGGNTSLLIGVNAGSVENVSLIGFDTSAAMGQTVNGATLTIAVGTGFTGGDNHGSELDTITIHELFDTNTGWNPGTQGITNSFGNVAAPGVVSFQFQGHDNTQWQLSLIHISEPTRPY